MRPGGNNGIGGEETSQRAVVPACVEEINSEVGFLSLARKFVVRAEVAESIPRLTEGFVERGSGLDSVRVRGDGRTAEMVTEQVGQCPARADSDSGPTREMV